MERGDRIGRGLKLKDIHTFRAVVQRRSMAKAAAELALTPPAISKVIGDMERLLGVRLLERTPQGVEPTAYGEALLKGAINLFDDLRQTVEQIETLADPTVGEVRIGTTNPLQGSLLTTVIDGLTRQYPKMVFHVTGASTWAELSGALRARSIDVLISRMNMEPEEDLEKEVLFDDPLVVVTGRANPRFRGRSVKLAQLMDEAWCLPNAQFIRQALRANGLTPSNVCVTCTSLPLQTALAETGRFFTVVPESYLRFRAANASLRTLALDLHAGIPPVGLATLKNRSVSPVTSLFIKTIRSVAKKGK